MTCVKHDPDLHNTIQNNLAILPIDLGVTRRCQKNGGQNKTKQKHSVHTIIAVSHKVDVERLAIILCFELKFKCSNVYNYNSLSDLVTIIQM